MDDATALNGVPPAPVIRARGVTKRYGRRAALAGVDLEVRPGEIYGVIGPDGAGKSSLLHAVCGVLTFDDGDLEVLGVGLTSERAAERIKGRLALMPQGLGLHLYPDLTVEENIDFFARLRLVPATALEPRKRRLLEVTRLAAFRARPVKHLSGGMKQKLGLACSLIHQPELIVLDEPTTGVDPVSRRDFWVLLSQLLRDVHATALVSTAYMDEATRFDRVSLMFDGRMVATLTGEELREAGTTVDDTFVAVLQRFGLATAKEPPLPRASAITPTPVAAAIEAVGATRSFGPFLAVDRVSFRVSPGEIFALLGPNGAGKSTVVKMLTGIIPPSSGTVRVAGVDVQTAPRVMKQRIGYMSQIFSLYRDLTVVENVQLYAGLYGLDRATTRARLEWILDMAGLEGRENTSTQELPTGLRQRLALGCALVHRPAILFLDEPTAGIDPVGRQHFWNTLTRLARCDGVAVLLTTHDLTDAGRCDRLGLMYRGQLIVDSAPDMLRRQTAATLGLAVGVLPSLEEVFIHYITQLEQRERTATERVA